MSDEDEEERRGTEEPVLTARLCLRPASAKDIAALAPLSAAPGIAGNMVGRPLSEPKDAGETFAIALHLSGDPVGAIMVAPAPDLARTMTIGCWIGEPHWGRGFGTEAMQAMIDRAFKDYETRALCAAIRVANHRARRVVEKCGFQFRGGGMVRSTALGGAVPVERFALERRNWEALRSWGREKGGDREIRNDAA